MIHKFVIIFGMLVLVSGLAYASEPFYPAQVPATIMPQQRTSWWNSLFYRQPQVPLNLRTYNVQNKNSWWNTAYRWWYGTTDPALAQYSIARARQNRADAATKKAYDAKLKIAEQVKKANPQYGKELVLLDSIGDDEGVELLKKKIHDPTLNRLWNIYKNIEKTWLRDYAISIEQKEKTDTALDNYSRIRQRQRNLHKNSPNIY